MTAPALSVLIPTISEQAALPFLLDDLGTLRSPHEVVVADGGSTDDTVACAIARGARVVATARGRGTQLAAAARVARAPVLLALHADVRLPPATIQAIDAYVRQPLATAVAFSLVIDAPGPSLALIAAGANLRSRLFHLPYGDQGLLLTRAMLDRAGGFPDIPIMEDVVLARALASSSGLVLSDARIHVSARRWIRVGPWRRSARNLALLAAFLCGVAPARIARWYER